MKYLLLEWLACPRCKAPDFKVEVFKCDMTQSPCEIVDGVLECTRCSKHYPIVGCIPRMLPDSFLEYHGYLSTQYPGNVPAEAENDDAIADFRKLCSSTRESFGFEWLRFEVTDSSEDFESFRDTTGFDKNELSGKLVLDAGCGMGRYTEVAASYGAEIVGVDLSRAVERAWRQTTHRPRVHLVQGDILNLPFNPRIFDFIYSIGVLHHTPNTERAFRTLCSLLRSHGRISIYVYPVHQPQAKVGYHKRFFAFLEEIVNDSVRFFTTRMPHRLLNYLSYIAVPLGWIKGKVLETKFRRILFWPVLLIPVSGHKKWQVRVCDTFDWLSPQFQWKHTTREVCQWFESEGLTEVRSLPRLVSITGTNKSVLQKETAAASRSTQQTIVA